VPRPPEGERICIRLKPETIAVIDKWAAEEGFSRAGMIRQILEDLEEGRR